MKRTSLLVLLVALSGCRSSTQLENPLAPPASLSASSLRGAVELRWEDVAGADGYVVYASSSGDPALARAFTALPPWTMQLDTAHEWSFSVAIRGRMERSATVTARPLPRALFAPPVSLTPTGLPRFGAALAIGDANGDGNPDLLVGAPSLFSGTGAAALFLGSGGTPSSSPAWITTGGADYGVAVAIAPDFNGDHLPDIAVGDDELGGTLNVFLGNGALFPSIPDNTFSGSGGLGATLDADGDITNDGLTDLLVSAPFSGNARGGVRIYPGGPFGLANDVWDYAPITLDDYTSELGLNGGTFAGDVNGDGRLDVVVGSLESGTNVRLLLGGPILPAPAPSWRPGQNTGTPGGLGAIVAVGDVNCDGFADIVARNENYQSSDGSLVGAIAIFFGNASLPADQPDVVLPDTGASTQLIRPLSVADFDGDGCADIAIGASDLGFLSTTPELQVFLGAPTEEPFPTTPAQVVVSDLTAADWGTVVKAGDLNGDGIADIAIGAPAAGTVEMFFAIPTRGPIADAGPAQRIVVGATAVFPLARFFDPVRAANSCTWDWDDGSEPTTVSPCGLATMAPGHLYPKTGIFHPLLTVTSGGVRRGTARTQVEVSP